MRRFFHGGLRDAEQRLRRLTAPEPADSDALLALIETSRVAGRIDRARQQWARVAESSVTSALARSAMGGWRAQSQSSQRRALGTVLLVADVVHLALMAWQGPTAGWIWLILPGIAAALGVVLILASLGPNGGAE